MNNLIRVNSKHLAHQNFHDLKQLFLLDDLNHMHYSSFWQNQTKKNNFIFLYFLLVFPSRIRLPSSIKSNIPAIIHTFIHELAHSVTVPEQVKEHCLTRLDKKLQPSVVKATKAKKYIANHHPETFYKNLAKMLRAADELGIYILPKNFRDFTPAGIKRYDTYVNPNDNMSLGTTNFAFE